MPDSKKSALTPAKTLTSVFRCAVVICLVATSGLALAREESEDLVMDLPDLVGEADLVVHGRVVRRVQRTRDSDVKIEVLEVFKGDPEIRYVRVLHKGGKFLIDPEEPFFASYEHAILFLKSEEDAYRCVFGKEGKKTVRNKNVYLHPDNNFLTMKMKKFRKKLAQAVQDDLSPRSP